MDPSKTIVREKLIVWKRLSIRTPAQFVRCLAVAVALGLSFPHAPAGAQSTTDGGQAANLPVSDAPALRLDLNKVEALESACRIFFLLQNEGAEDYRRLTFDLVFFDRSGIVDRRLSVDAAPLPAGKTSLKQFDVPGMDCATVTSLLLNAVLACEAEQDLGAACLQGLTLQSRADIRFFK